MAGTLERQIRPAHADAIHRSHEALAFSGSPTWYSANLMLDEPPLIVRMHGLAGFMDDSFIMPEGIFPTASALQSVPDVLPLVSGTSR